MDTGWTLTHHARKQCAAKHISPAAVLLAATSPSVTYEHGRAHPGQWRHIRGGIVAVVDPIAHKVITVYVNVTRTPLRADQLVNA